MEELDVVDVPEFDAAIGAAGNHVVLDDGVVDVGEFFAGFVGGRCAGVAEGDAAVAIENPVALDEEVLGADPDEYRGATAAVAAFYVSKGVVAENPFIEGHHVDGGDVVAVEEPIGGRNFVVFEIAEAHGAADGVDVWIVAGGAFDGADADVAEAAVEDVDVARGVFGFDFDAVGTGFGEGEGSDGDVRAIGDVDDVVAIVAGFPTFALECDGGWIAGNAADGDVLFGAEDEGAIEFVDARFDDEGGVGRELFAEG